jgi:hypothetical protein
MAISSENDFQVLVAAALQTNPDGSRRFSNEDVAHFLPWVMVNLGADPAGLGDAAAALFVSACRAAGVVPADNAQQVSQKFDAHYRAFPPQPALLSAFEAAYRQVNQGASMLESPFARLSGEKPSTGVLGGGGPRPAGTVAAGPMARFAIKKSDK